MQAELSIKTMSERITAPLSEPASVAEPIVRLKARVEKDLQKVEYGMRQWINSQVEPLNQITRYVLDTGGKRFRPKLMILASYLCGHAGPNVIALAASFEFIHTASLLHDDVVDRADVRRGRSTANALWGNKAAILAGDFFYSRACELITQYGNTRLLKTATEATSIMSEGELEQLALDRRLHLSETDYMRMIERKTAVLMAAICRASALAAELSLERVTSLENYGLQIGLAFQLSDDSLDYAALESDLGKKIGKDALDGIVTLPLLHTYCHAGPAERERIREAIARQEPSDEDRLALLALVSRYDGVRYTLAKAMERAEAAKQSLEPFPDSTEKAALELLADHAVNRIK